MWQIRIFRIPLQNQTSIEMSNRHFLQKISSLKSSRNISYSKRITIKLLSRPNPKCFHSSAKLNNKKKDEYYAKMALKETKDKELVSRDYFEDTSEKNRETFKNAIEIFNSRDTRKRGSVEFIYAALKHMKQFDCHRDAAMYKALIDILPKGQYVPENLIQADFWHYPKQQDCITEVLTQMELNRVMPDEELGELLRNIFGIYSGPYKKYSRLCYWMPKLRNLSPFPLPLEVPRDKLELAQLAVDRILGSVDPMTSISIYDAGKELSEIAIDKTWIVSGISEEQQEMIKALPKDKPLYVEGGFRVWLRETQVTYFILRGEAAPRNRSGFDASRDSDDIVGAFQDHWVYGDKGDNQTLPDANRHEEEDGTIIAVAATGTSSRDSLLSWIRFLQRDNPDLENIPILFTLQSPIGEVVPLSDNAEDGTLTPQS